MRRILVENARRKRGGRRGGGRRRERLDRLELAAAVGRPIPSDLLDLDEALNRLAADDHEAARLVEAGCFAGLTLPPAADVLGPLPPLADRLWAYARLLYRALHTD